MGARIRLGCLGFVFLLGLALIVFWRPISKSITNWMWDSTTADVAAALPNAERQDAIDVCNALWTHIREHGISEELADEYKSFADAAWAMLKNQEVTEEEARAFVKRARDMLLTLDPDSPFGDARAP